MALCFRRWNPINSKKLQEELCAGARASRAEFHEDGSSDEDSEEVRARRNEMERTEKTERKAFERARGAERQAEADMVKYLAWRNVSFLFKGWNTL